jgi:hypothetical protein
MSGTVEVRAGTEAVRSTHVFCQQTVELFFAVLHPHSVARIDDPDECICLFKVVSPVRPEGPLTTDIPLLSVKLRIIIDGANTGLPTYVQSVAATGTGTIMSGCSGQSSVQSTYFPWTNVLILNPRVGLIPEISSLLSFLRIVVFPALSSPLLAGR